MAMRKDGLALRAEMVETQRLVVAVAAMMALSRSFRCRPDKHLAFGDRYESESLSRPEEAGMQRPRRARVEVHLGSGERKPRWAALASQGRHRRHRQLLQLAELFPAEHRKLEGCGLLRRHVEWCANRQTGFGDGVPFGRINRPRNS